MNEQARIDLTADDRAIQPKMTSGREGDWLTGHSQITNLTYICADALAIIISALLSHVVTNSSIDIGSDERAAILIAALITGTVFNAGGLYASWRGRPYVDQIRSATVAWMMVVLLVILSNYVADLSALNNKPWAMLWAVFGLAAILAIRLSAMVVLRVIRERGLNHKRVVIVGSGKWAEQVIQRINAANWLGLDIVSVFDHNSDRHGSMVAGCPIRGGYDLLLQEISEQTVDEVWICLPVGSRRSKGDHAFNDVLDILENSTVDQRLLPDIEELRILDRPVREMIGLPIIDLNSTPMRGINRVVKAIEDRLLAAVILILVSPVMALIAVAIKIEDPRGTVFFQQLRHGWDGKTFKMLKFRTMKSHDTGSDWVQQATKDDPRVTKVGEFLRRNSLDEMPQFLHALQGSMSIVGPRPHAVEHNEFYRTQIKSYMHRHMVKPGITGWAQVNGFRGETSNVQQMRQRVNHDLYYIEHWSLWLDLKIIFRTIWHGFRGENAF